MTARRNVSGIRTDSKSDRYRSRCILSGPCITARRMSSRATLSRALSHSPDPEFWLLKSSHSQEIWLGGAGPVTDDARDRHQNLVDTAMFHINPPSSPIDVRRPVPRAGSSGLGIFAGFCVRLRVLATSLNVDRSVRTDKSAPTLGCAGASALADRR